MAFINLSALKPTVTDPDVIEGLPLDMDDWGCNAWIVYHKRIKERRGQQEANEVVGVDMDRTSIFANVNICSFSCGFQNYFVKQGFETGGPISGILCETSEGLESGVKTITQPLKTTEFLTKPPVLIGAGLLVGGIWMFGTRSGKRFRKKFS